MYFIIILLTRHSINSMGSATRVNRLIESKVRLPTKLAYIKREKNICKKAPFICIRIKTLIGIQLTFDIVRFAIRKTNFFFSILGDVPRSKSLRIILMLSIKLEYFV